MDKKLIVIYKDRSQEEFILDSCDVTIEQSNMQPGENVYLTINFIEENELYYSLIKNINNIITCIFYGVIINDVKPFATTKMIKIKGV